jgi:Ca2+-binding RTX toxin-like protein
MNRYGLRSWSEHHHQVLPTEKGRPRGRVKIMMRRTLLLVATTALTLIAAGGIALAATFTCTTNPCDGTIEDDMITGTLNAETINGKGGADQISAQDGNDTINGEDGTDRLNGGAGDDQLDGGGGGTSDPNTTADYYYLTTNWGKDTLTDATGTDYILPVPDGGATAAAMPNLIVNLVSGTGPEVTDGNGNTVDWNDNVIEGVLTGAGDDVISQSPTSNGLNGGAGSDTYTGYTTGFPGSDSINDPSGTADVLDLSSRNLATTSWRIFKVRSTDNVEILQLEFFGGGSVLLSHYFDSTTTDVCASKPGPGLIETIKFADDPSVDFAQVRSLLGCPPLETAITSMTMEPWEASTKTTFRFSSNDGEAAFECKLDGGTFEVCTSPKEYPGLIEGSTHTFEVRAVDPAGNTDPTPARRTWTVDTTPPMVSSTNPVNNATGIATTAVVDAFFSEQMDRSTVTTSTFTLTKQGSSTPVSARVEYLSNPKALLTPSSVLEANTTYTATVKGGPGGVKDLAGYALAQDFSWTFTTAAPPTSCTKTGTSSADVLQGTTGDDVICGLGGSDTIKALGGNDILRGDAGNDKLFGGSGNDTLDGSLGTDTANFSEALAAITASLSTNTATGDGSDTLAGVENLIGSPKNDTLTGSEANNTINGGGGADTLDGLGGADTLTGAGGNDTEHGGLGNDSVVGSGGADSLFGDENDDTVNSKDGVNGNDSLDGGAGTDTKVTDTTEKSIVGFP